MSKDEFAKKLASLLEENGFHDDVEDMKEVILSFLDNRAEWMIINSNEDNCE